MSPLSISHSLRRWALVPLFFMAAPLCAQSSSVSPYSYDSFNRYDPRAVDERNPGIDRQKMIRLMNEERRKKLLAEIDKLLAQTAELDAEIAAQQPKSLTVDQVNKLVVIEKLARDIRNRMNSWTTFEEFNPFFSPRYPPIR